MAVYKIKDIEVLTDIKAHTIRIWEKRYNILEPSRTDTKIRTYSEADLVKLLNISILNNHGWKISKIADMSEAELSEKILTITDQAKNNSATVTLLIKSLTEMDELLFHRVVDKHAEKEGFKQTFLNYVWPFLDRIGIMWLAGAINPAQEHFISNLLRQKLIVAIAHLPIPQQEQTDYILFCRSDEWHELSLLFYHFCIQEQGNKVSYLGQNVPLEALVKAVDILQPNKGVVTSLIAAVNEKNITSYFKKLSEQINLPIYVGGAQASKIIRKELPTVLDVDQIL